MCAVAALGCFLAVIVMVRCQFRFDYTYNVKAGGWLKLHEMPLTFHEAFRRCSAEGAVLASPLDMYLKNAMIHLQKKRSSDSCPLFTGIHASIAKGAYTSIEGIPLSKIPVTWAPNEPDNFNGTEDCIAMLPTGSLADVRCTESFPFICYKKKNKNLSLNDCGTIDNEYIMESKTGLCYKYHKFGRSWKNAYMTCIAEGGHLAVIRKASDVDVIKAVFARTTHEHTFGWNKQVAHIGYYDWGELGVFYTIHGTTLEDTGYSKFGPGNPDNAHKIHGDVVCGAIDRAGLLFDVWCNNDIATFICEKKPDSLLSDEDF